MKTIRRQAEMAALRESWRRRGKSVGFVATMGALHAGHASLIARARRENDRVAVSVFVNPLQFGPKEDFSRYPRTLAADAALCAREGADALYRPDASEVYPEGFASEVSVPSLAATLCGPFRPGHFKGVATVVLKLLATVGPRRAYFGEKDYQQLAIIRRLSRDLDLGVEIVGCPTVREEDGLALSSRNRYLSPVQRRLAPALLSALRLGERLAREGLPPRRVESRVAKALLEVPGLAVDYASLADADTLAPAARSSGRLRLLAAVRLGKTRLIDNIPVLLG